jgi:uncharacterized protein YllA (UPF0747 family)
MNISVADLFLDQNDLMTKVTKDVSKIDIDFTPQKEHLKKQFEDLYTLADQTDKSFKGAVGAQETKQIKGLENLEHRLLKAQKRKLQDVLERVKLLQDELFPRQSLQERSMNFSEFFMEFGEALLPALISELDPLNEKFIILEI